MKLPLIAAACAVLALAGPAANAFTLENPGNGKVDGGVGYTDLSTHFDAPTTKDGKTTLQSGNTTFQFRSQRSFNDRYDPSRLFDPLARDR